MGLTPGELPTKKDVGLLILVTTTGRLLAALDETRVRDNTAVIFWPRAWLGGGEVMNNELVIN